MGHQYSSEADRIAARIRNDILDGVREPGSKLVERDLADRVGVSRIPVRDAPKTLTRGGLCAEPPPSGAIVREFTPSDIADIDEVRSALEVLAFKLAAQRRTAEGLDRLRRSVDAEAAAVAAGDVVAAR